MLGYILLLFFLLFNCSMFASSIPVKVSHEYTMDYSARQLSFSEGLSHHSINCICEDSQNNIWIGTFSGLNKLTENQVEKYFTNSLSDNGQKNIKAIACDAQDNVWAVCGMTLERLRVGEDEFKKVQGLSGIQAILLTKENCLYVSAREGIWRYDSENDSFIKKLAIKFNDVKKMVELDSEHFLLLRNGKGIQLWNIQNNTVQNTSITENVRYFDPLVVIGEGEIWKINMKNELVHYRWERENDSFRVVKILDKETLHLSHTVIELCERNGKILIGTDGEGIKILDPQTLKVTSLEAGRNAHLVKSCRCLYIDRYSNIWVGTPRLGCVLLRESFVNVWTDVSIPGESRLSSTVITGICQMPDRNIYISTDGGGVNKLNPETRWISFLTQTKDEKVTSMIPYGNNHLLLYIYEKGFFLMDLKTEKMQPFFKFDITCKSYNVKLYKEKRFLELLGNVFMVYDEKEGSLRNFTFTDGNVPNWCFFVNDGNFSFHREKIYQIDPVQAEISPIYVHDKEIFTAACSLNGDRIYFSDEDGLNVFELNTRECRHLLDLKIPVTVIKCVDEEQVWFGNVNGIYCMNSDESVIFQLDESEGVPQDSYNPAAVCVADNGRLYLGGVRALVEVNRKVKKENISEITVQPVSIQIDNRTPEDLTQRDGKMIRVPWNYNSITVNVRKKGNIYLNVNKNMKLFVDGKYSLTDIVSSSSFQLPSLPPGRYKISIATEDSAGKYGTPELIAILKVKAPFWKTAGGLVVIILILTLIAVFVVIYIYNYKKQVLKRKYEKKEKVLLKMQNNFLINISHEFRTPLTLIFSPLKKLLSNGDRNSEIYGEVRMALRHAVNMNSLIDMVLDVTKIEKNKEGLLLHHACFNRWLMAVVEDFQPEFDNHEVLLVADLDNQIEMVDFDVNRCRMVLSNFLMNALKFSPAGTEVRVTSRNLGGKVRVSVSDRGKGIDDKNIKNCFRRYWQGEGSKGFGIGLSYAKIIVDMHHGDIGVYNNEGPGATFWFELPFVQEDNPNNERAEEIMDFFKSYETQTESVVSEIHVETKNCSILIVDDNEELRTSLVHNSTGLFANVYEAGNGKDALGVLFDKSPDLVISDVKMPVMDGYELCRTIKSTLEISHIPVILLSSYAAAEQKLVGYKIGADAYLAKPFDFDLLLAMVQKELYTRESLRKKYSESLAPIKPSESTFSGPDENFITKLNEIITNNIDNSEMGINLILQEMQMGRNQFYAKLKSLTDMTLRAYINRIRINMACSMIDEGNSDFSDIAYRLGYSSPAYFSTVFKQEMGVSPKEYRSKKS